MNEELQEELASNSNHEDMRFEGIDFTDLDIDGHTFENCEFKSCLIIKDCLDDTAFMDCKFMNSNLNILKLKDVTLNGVEFIDSKLTAVNFTHCNSFGFSVEFERTVLQSVAFFENSLLRTSFKECILKECDFYNCNLKGASFQYSRFEDVKINECNLEQADFLNAEGYEISPFTNKLKKAKFDLPQAVSFLNFLGIELRN